MNLTEFFHNTLAGHEDDPAAQRQVARAVLSAPATPESTALLALMYHEGIGVKADLDKAFDLAEKAAADGEGLAYFLLGYMCDNIETPDQRTGGPRQKYDHYDAERFYTLCAATDCRWSDAAHLWLGDYFMDSAQGGDPDQAVEHYEAIADNNAEAAGKLSDYYWDQLDVDAIIPDEFRDRELEEKIYHWTSVAVRLNPHDYSYRMGWCHADGIGCNKAFRLARKYWEDAYEFGDWQAAEAIADLYEQRLEELQARPEPSESECSTCTREIASWRKLAARTRERLGESKV